MKYILTIAALFMVYTCHAQTENYDSVNYIFGTGKHKLYTYKQLDKRIKEWNERDIVKQKNYDWIVYGCQFLSGASTGVREEDLYYSKQMFTICPRLNRQWWDSRISYRNKYSEAPELVAFSDANHFFKAATLALNCVSVGFSFSELPKHGKLLYIGKRILMSYVANHIGFAMTYNGYFRNKLL